MIASICLGAVAALGTALSIVLKPEISIKNKKIPIFWLAPAVAAIILIALGLPTIKEAADGLTFDMLSMLEGRSSVNPIKILLLFFSMTAISVFLDEEGVFNFLATKSVRLAGHSQKKLFFILYAVVSVLTIFTSNDIIILTFTPFIVYFCKNAKISPIPYLVSEFVAANTFSMLLIIGNPTNIYLAESYGITFGEYLKTMAIPAFAGGLTALGTLYLVFNKKLASPISTDDFGDAVISKPVYAIFGAILLIICLVCLVIADYVGVEMWAISVSALIALVIGVLAIALARKESPVELRGVAKRLPYELIPFVISMFVIVLSLKQTGVASAFAEAFGSFGADYDILTYGISSTLCANLINNIPMSVLFSAITEKASPFAVYAAVAGSNIGAFLTPIGALAGIMFTGLLKTLGVRFTFFDFVRYGALVALPTLIATLGGLYIVYFVF